MKGTMRICDTLIRLNMYVIKAKNLIANKRYHFNYILFQKIFLNFVNARINH